MNILILTSDYPTFVNSLYLENDGLEDRSYQEQWAIRADSMFGMADFYSRAFRELGHQAEEVFASLSPLLLKWGEANGVRPTWFERFVDLVRWKRKRFCAYRGRMLRLTSERIRMTRPDLVLNHDMSLFDSEFFRPLRGSIRFLVGQQACTEVWRGNSSQWTPFIKTNQDWSIYDLIISSMPSSVEWFANRGANARLNRLGIDTQRVAEINPSGRRYNVSFIGSFSEAHSSRLRDLEQVGQQMDIDVWAPRGEIPGTSVLRKCYHGEAFGRRMFQTLSDSRITLNHHGNVRPHANNCRLFEATATGTLLLTDWKPDLHELFEPEKEVATFSSPEECAEQAERYLKDASSRDSVAAAGRRRCLAEHSYTCRMRDLLDHLGANGSRRTVG